MKKLLLPILAMIPLLSMAGGFQVNLQGNQQSGMGHLGTSFYLGASSAYFNPAMMGMSDTKFSLEAGASGITSTVIYQNQSTGLESETDNPLGTPFYLYGTAKLNRDITAGLAVYTPFGSGVTWGDDWDGKYLIRDISLRAIFIQPTLSIQANDNLNIGLGFIYATGKFELNRAVGFSSAQQSVGSTNLSGSASGMGFNFGLHYKVTEKFNIGLSYRSAVTMTLRDGDAEFDLPASTAGTVPPTNSFDAELPLPSTSTIGASYQINDKFLVAVEYSFVDWYVYRSLDFDFETETDGFKDSKNPRNYKASSIYRFGIQYQPSEKLIARVGAYYDESPIQDNFFNPETPNTDNIGLTCGLTYNFSDKLSADASFIYIDGQERDSYYQDSKNRRTLGGENFGGKYKASSIIPGIGLHYNF